METMAMLFASGAGAGATGAAAGAAAGATLGGTALAITGPELFLGTAASAVGAGGGVTAATAGAGLFGSLGFNDMLSGAFDAVSVIGDVLGTGAQNDQNQQLARDRELQALTVRNQSSLDQIAALEDLNARVGEQIANTFAGGLTTSGSPEQAINDAIEQNEFETRVGGRDAEIRALQLQAEADAARGATTSILFSGLATAGSRLFTSNQRDRRRG